MYGTMMGWILHVLLLLLQLCSAYCLCVYSCTSQIKVTFDLAHVVMYILHGLCTCSSSRHHPHDSCHCGSTLVFMTSSHHSLRDHRVHAYINVLEGLIISYPIPGLSFLFLKVKFTNSNAIPFKMKVQTSLANYISTVKIHSVYLG